MRYLKIAFLAALICTSALAQSSPRRRAIVPPPSLEQWIARSGIPFATVEAIDDDSDLLPLRGVIGDAPYVGVGEATHGSHEFFAMKHRLFRFLAERMGFTVFSIEASLPECDKINDYVQNGAGDPSALVRNMHFWTWNVDEVLDLVLWMRSYNAAHPDRPQLSFRGFDLQFSQMAIADLLAYLQRVDPASVSKSTSMLACANVSYSLYASQPATTKTNCRFSVRAVHDDVAAARTRYVAASSEGEYERMLRYARVVVQFEEIAGHSVLARDPFMAENAEWIVETEHPGEKMMLWAHNYHISTIPDTMGSNLREHWKSQYVTMGFLFDAGDFNAVDANGSGLHAHHVDPSQDGGFETFFRPSGQPRLIVDLRAVPAALAADLAVRRNVWMIGAVFPTPRATESFSHDFDVAIWIERSTPSRLRP